MGYLKKYDKTIKLQMVSSTLQHRASLSLGKGEAMTLCLRYNLTPRPCDIFHTVLGHEIRNTVKSEAYYDLS